MRERVLIAAKELGLEIKVTTLPSPTRTVGEAASAVGCPDRQIAKSIVFVADGDPVLCIASGAHQVDPDRVCEEFDAADARQATPDEVRVATGCPVGGVAPFGHGLPVLLDADLLGERRVYASGGDCNTLIEIDPRQLADRTGARVAPIGAERRSSAPAT